MKRPSTRSVAYVQQRKAQKVVKNVYLRADIPCASLLCSQCTQFSSQLGIAPVLSSTPKLLNKFSKHYVVPDTNILLNCIDVMEQSDVFMDVIILQTVLEEVRNRSSFVYNRLRKLVTDQEKRFYVFHNDFHISTHVTRRSDETINDRNDRSIRTAVQWYQAHLNQTTSKARGESLEVQVVLVTNDRLNREAAVSDGISALSVEDYLLQIPGGDQVIDSVQGHDFRTPRDNKENIYSDHVNQTKLQEGLKKGSYLRGVFNVAQYNYLQASVATAAYDQPIQISGKEDFNRATNGDLVAIEVLPKAEWQSPSEKFLDNSGAEPIDDLSTVPRLESTDNPAGSQPTARVVAILKRNWRPFVGYIDPNSIQTGAGVRSSQTLFFVPSDRRLPRIKLKSRQADNLKQKKVIVNIDEWTQDSRYPTGHLVKILGPQEDKETEIEALLLEWDVQYRPFPKAVTNCLPPEGDSWKVPRNLDATEWQNRRDLRHLSVCSIDPPGCQDIDDALHARQLPNGNLEIGVHIADVSSFVKANNPMDEEAASRGTTVYLVDKRIDMLPSLLGTNLCSLMPNVERFAFSTIWEMTPEAQIISVQFTKSVINSKQAFTYEQAQARIDGGSASDELTIGMRALLRLSKILRSRRLAAGALNLASPEVKIEMDSETSEPVDVQSKVAFDTNSLVEEFMLLANISVAKRIHEAFPDCAMLRRHGTPPAGNFESLQDMLRVRRGMTLKTESSRALADSLDSCVDSAEPFFNTLVRIMATRCMLSAEYFSSGQTEYDEYKHYGLASEIYTHFTSPIRRYADVIVHRQLSAAIGFESLDPAFSDPTNLVNISKNINYRHRMAQMAGRASVEYYVGQAIKDNTAVEDAFVMKVFQNGFAVFVAKFGIEGVIPISSFADPAPAATLHPDKYELEIKGKNMNLTVGIFDKLSVRVSTKLDTFNGKRKVVIELVTTNLLS